MRNELVRYRKEPCDEIIADAIQYFTDTTPEEFKISDFCKKIMITPTSYRKWINEWDEFADLVNPILDARREHIIDIAENSLVARAKEGDVKACTWILDHIGAKYRDYQIDNNNILNTFFVKFDE